MKSALLDTSFLISLSDQNRQYHQVALQYFSALVTRRIPLFLSTIVISEFQVKQDYTDLPLRNLIVLPFNIDHAVCCGQLVSGSNRAVGDDRVRVKDDLKLIAQCQIEGISHLLTEDENTLAKYLRRASSIMPILLKDGFDDGWF